MTLLYLLFGLGIVIANFGALPDVLAQIVGHAFSPAPAVGGFAGAGVAAAIQAGTARGMLSNEAGLGTAPMVHANADTVHPFRQGMWGAAEVFIDTIVMCSITAFIILSSGALANGETGIELLLAAFSTVYSTELAQAFVSFSILTFCLSTQIGFFVYFETAMTDLFGARAFRYLRWIYFLPGVIFSGITQVDQLWMVADISVAVSALPNLVALVFLSGVFLVLMRDYTSGTMRYTTRYTDGGGDWVRRAEIY